MKASAFQIVTLSKPDKEFSQLLAYARHVREKHARFIAFLFMRMIGKW